MSTLTRGPLPARVYWVRRVLAVVLVTALVLGAVQLVSLLVGSGASPEPDRAAPVAAEPTSTPTAGATAAPDDEDAAGEGEKKRKKKGKDRKDREPVLAEPEGPCLDRDIAVTPTAEETVGGSPVTFTLELRTILSPACTWEVSAKTLSVKVTSGDDDIWFSQQCPRSIPAEDVVLRSDVTTEVDVTWSAKRSDAECSGDTDWALPGWYHVEAAALAGEPSDLQFRLTAPEPEVVTETVDPEPKQGQGRDGRGDDGEKKDRG
jgi:hypothetical protein